SRGRLGCDTSKMPSPLRAPGDGFCAGWASRLTTMRPFDARTLCECVPAGISRLASCRGDFGSLTATMDVPWGAFIWGGEAARPSTTTCPPPGQSKYPTCRSPCALALISRRLAQVVELDHVFRRDLAPHALR